MLIKNYIYTLGKYLPEKNRADIGKEVEATIYEQLLVKYGEKDYSNEEITEVLYEIGSPRVVAEAYLGKPHTIISSELIPIYFMVSKITLIAIIISLMVTGIIETVQADLPTIAFIIDFIAGSVNACLSTFGVITLIFILISRKGVSVPETDEWQISSLSKFVPAEHRISIVEKAFEIGFTIMALIWLNYFTAGLYMKTGAQTRTLELFNTSEFANIIPIINTLWGLSIALSLYLIIRGTWDRKSRIADSVLSLAGLAVFALVVFGKGYIDFSVVQNLLNSEIVTVLKSILSISVVVTAFFTGLTLWKHAKAEFISK
ncbi:MAG: hypothetical protein BGO41_04155 [Clostridiales bacterium 38-18]|nr:MAG: hypothetical protein BGO41_04155 [Clostridiales bacterium 38-18]